MGNVSLKVLEMSRSKKVANPVFKDSGLFYFTLCAFYQY